MPYVTIHWLTSKTSKKILKKVIFMGKFNIDLLKHKNSQQLDSFVDTLALIFLSSQIRLATGISTT